MTEKNLITELKEHFVEAGFTEATSLMAEICPIPDGTLVMNNSYALMVCCTVLSEDDEIGVSLKRAKEEMHGFIRRALLALENQKGLIIDGYLLIILNQAPKPEVKEVVREIEADTKVCRKHIVWPLTDETGLDRLQFVTILSLPEPLHDIPTNTTDFKLSAEASSLLNKYDELGSLDRLLDTIKSGGLGRAD